jgi:hypothetical protein
VIAASHSIVNSGIVQVCTTILGGLMLAGILYLVKLARNGADAARRARDAADDATRAVSMNAQAQHETELTLNEVARKVSTPAQGTIGEVAARTESTSAETKELVVDHIAADDARFQALWEHLGLTEPTGNSQHH